MRIASIAAIIAIISSVPLAVAETANWRTFAIPETGTSVDIPYSIFSEQAGRPPEGYGQRFQTPDHRANLTIQTTTNESGDTPSTYLTKKHPPPHIQYKRVMSNFFVVSSYKGDAVWYDRCNFSGRYIHCVLINYPAREERAWDDIVTRISRSLSAGT
jgi:hypothetical protein